MTETAIIAEDLATVMNKQLPSTSKRGLLNFNKSPIFTYIIGTFLSISFFCGVDIIIIVKDKVYIFRRHMGVHGTCKVCVSGVTWYLQLILNKDLAKWLMSMMFGYTTLKVTLLHQFFECVQLHFDFRVLQIVPFDCHPPEGILWHLFRQGCTASLWWSKGVHKNVI